MKPYSLKSMFSFPAAFKYFLTSCLVLSVLTAGPVFAERSNPVLIRDTEIETDFKTWMSPLLKAADIGQNNVNLVIVQSPQINAFVAGGANIFVYTGLIERTDSPGEITGVLAHELGHVAGGHLIGMRAALERASYESILGMVLGVGAAIATGNGGAANAIISGAGTVAQQRFLAHSRVNEASADQAAIRFLDSAQMNPKGLASFLEKLESEELLPTSQQSEYVRTHPLTRDRVDTVENGIAKSPYLDKALPAEWIEQHKRMKAKLLAFTNPGRVPWVYDDRDKTIPAQYARAIAAYRQNETEKALKDIDALIKLEPTNPYFQELKGQMLKDFGRVKDALPYYEKAVSLLPAAGLIRIDLAHALLESNTQGAEQKAIDHLERALQDEPRSSLAHRLLATAYGKTGREPQARLHLAEEAVLQRRLPYAKSQAESVLKEAQKDSHEWLQAKDILANIETLENMEQP